MSSKLFQVQSIFLLLLLFCTSVLSAGIELGQYPETAKGNKIRTWVGTQQYQTRITPELLTSEAIGTLGWLSNHVEERFRPKVVSALVTGGDKIYFASSAKGSGKIFNDPKIKIDERIKRALQECGDTHRNDQRCGEIMVLASWYRQNPGKNLNDVPSKLIVAVDENGIKNPCSGKDGNKPYGCKDFLEELGFKKDEIIRKPNQNRGRRRGAAKHSVGGKSKGRAPKPRAKSAAPGNQAPKKPSTARRHTMRSLVELKGYSST